MRDFKSIIVQCAGMRVKLLASQQLCHVEYCHHNTRYDKVHHIMATDRVNNGINRRDFHTAV